MGTPSWSLETASDRPAAAAENPDTLTSLETLLRLPVDRSQSILRSLHHFITATHQRWNW
jgi:hypothetical protein